MSVELLGQKKGPIVCESHGSCALRPKGIEKFAVENKDEHDGMRKSQVSQSTINQSANKQPASQPISVILHNLIGFI